MTEMTKKTAIITGASSGIGLSISQHLHSKGYNIAMLARNKSKLVNAAKQIRNATMMDGEILHYSVDVTDKKEINKICHEVGEQFGIHYLICNAGIASFDYFANKDLNYFEKIFNTNFYGAVYLIHSAWSYLTTTKGHIGIVSSVAGYSGIIGQSGYASSKFALVGLAESLRMEGKKSDINVSVIYPPNVATPMLEKEKEFALKETNLLTNPKKAIPPERVAQKLISGMENSTFEIFCDYESRFIRMLRIIFPTLFFYLEDKKIE